MSTDRFFSNLMNKIVKHELIEKFLDNKQLPQLFESLCSELIDKMKYLPKEDKEKIQKASEKVYKS